MPEIFVPNQEKKVIVFAAVEVAFGFVPRPSIALRNVLGVLIRTMIAELDFNLGFVLQCYIVLGGIARQVAARKIRYENFALHASDDRRMRLQEFILFAKLLVYAFKECDS